jgi:hypothetical protein
MRGSLLPEMKWCDSEETESMVRFVSRRTRSGVGIQQKRGVDAGRRTKTIRVLNLRKYKLGFIKSCCEVRILNLPNFHAVRKKAGGTSIPREKLLPSPTHRSSYRLISKPLRQPFCGMADTKSGESDTLRMTSFPA